jgi:hypothetical protein
MIDMGLMQADMRFQFEGGPAGLFKTDVWKSLELGFYIDEFIPKTNTKPRMVFGFAVALHDEELAAKLSEFLALSVDEDPLVSVTRNGNKIFFVAATFKHEGEKLSSNTSFQNSRSASTEETFLYMDIGDLIPKSNRAVQAKGPPAILPLYNALMDGIGLESVKHFSVTSGWNNGDSITNGSLWFSEKSKGLIASSLLAPAADLSLAEYIPANATSFSIASMDASAGWKFINNLIEQALFVAENEGETIPKDHPLYVWLAGERQGELSEALSAIGPRTYTWGVQDASALMGGGATQGGTFIEVHDIPKVRATFAALMGDLEKLTETSEYGSLSVKNLTERSKNEEGKWVTSKGAEYYQVDINISSLLPPDAAAAGMALANFKPSIGITDDGWLVFNTSSSAIKKAMRKGVQKSENGIKTNPDAASFLNSVPNGALQAKWSDLRPMIGGAITMLQGMLPMFMGGMGPDFPLDLNKFPSPDVFTKNIRPSETWSVRDGNQLRFESVGSFGLGEGALLGVTLTAGFLVVLPGSPSDLTASSSAPLLTDAHDDAHELNTIGYSEESGLDDTTAELSRLQSTILVYQLETESLPMSLQDLEKPADGWPEGFLTDGLGVQPDPWGNAFIYKLDGENGFNLYSCGPNGQDDGGAGDDISIG